MLADIENADPLSDAAKGRGHLVGVLAARSIIVDQHDDVGAAQVVGILVAPLLDAAGAGRRLETNSTEIVDVLLALGDKDRLSRSNSPREFGQPRGNAAHVAEFPDPATVTIRLALTEVLWLKAHDLEQQRAVLVAIIIGLDNLGLRMADDLRRPEQAFASQPCGRLVVSLPSD